jgi:UDP:flavonoid glycosyltransferase YjiC (YdhE family)
VTHGGHGTFMRALKNGLPMVVIPGLGGDQPINAAAVEAWGVGRALPADAGADAMRAAVSELLASRAYRDRAAEISRQLRDCDGARGAAEEIEGLLPASIRKAS